MTTCPLCGATRTTPLFEKDGWAYERCATCGLATRGGGETPPSYHDYLPSMTQTLPPLTRKRYETLLARLAQHRGAAGRFLDVGCGGGFLVETARDLGWRAEGVEVSRAAAEFGRARGLEIHVGMLSDAKLPAGEFDVIAMMEVIEHVPTPVALLAECAELLRPGGALYLTTPNWGSLSRRVLGARWSAVNRDHVVYFTPRHMRRALRAAGLVPRGVTTANIQPHEILARFRGGRVRSTDATPMQRTMALRETVESNPFLSIGKRAANACLAATGTGDTIRALAEKP